MKKLLLTLTTLSLLHTAQAEIIEGNITLQLKLTREVDRTTTNTSDNSRLVSSSFENVDFIQAMSVLKGGTPFSKSAKLIYRYDGALLFYIRDKGQADYKVSDYLGIALNGSELVAQPIASRKVKFQEANPGTTRIGTEKYLIMSKLVVGTSNSEAYTIIGHGITTQTVRYIRSKEDPERTFFTLGLSMSGAGTYAYPPNDGGTPDFGVMDGTVKFSGTKVLPSPILPEM